MPLYRFSRRGVYQHDDMQPARPRLNLINVLLLATLVLLVIVLLRIQVVLMAVDDVNHYIRDNPTPCLQCPV